jgi:hypothetical protein
VAETLTQQLVNSIAYVCAQQVQIPIDLNIAVITRVRMIALSGREVVLSRFPVAQGLQDPQPHVRWAACQALGQMCTDLGPDLQDQQHAAVLPGLLAAMDDFNAPRVQVGCCYYFSA